MRNFLAFLEKLEEGVIAFLLLFLAVVTFLETSLRYTVSLTFMWFNEFANYTLIFMTFLGASLGVKYGTHFSMEALTEKLPGRWPHILKFVAYLISSILCCLFVIYGLKHVQHLMTHGVKSSAMRIPMYFPYLPIPIFSGVMALRFMILSFLHLKKFFKRHPFEAIRKT